MRIHHPLLSLAVEEHFICCGRRPVFLERDGPVGCAGSGYLQSWCERGIITTGLTDLCGTAV